MVVIGPWFEEVLYRGFLFAALRNRFGAPAAIIGSSVVFAISHAYSLHGTLIVFAIGLLLGWIRHRTGNLTASFAAHAGNNLLQSIPYLLTRL